MSKKNKKKEVEVEVEDGATTASETTTGGDQPTIETETSNGDEGGETVQALKDRLQRLAAEYQNFRKQADKRSVESRRFVKRDLVQQLLPVVDNFGHAMQALEQGQDAQNVLFGVKMIHEMLGKFLEDNGVNTIKAVGTDFDPALHEAVSREETDEAPANKVLGEVQKGYVMGDLVVRHARVVVAAPKSAANDETAAEPEAPETER
ncbi:MAG: nucleotide exchange factor GrpE [Planctomycetes bacterium]|nr:nucleotide exchange factor GrpE [Planctomycetota bacterium]